MADANGLDGRETLRAQYAFAQDNLADTAAKCPPELLAKTITGSSTNPLGATWAHAVITQDLLLVGWLQGREPVHRAGGWADRTGFELPQSPVISREWANALRVDAEGLRGYAAAVREAVDGYLAEAPAEALLEEVSFGPRPRAKLWVFGTLGVWHVATHQGEMAALLGLEGLRGQML